ncbi:MAG: carboxypeptidase M32 [Phycisphaerales bacterium]
MSQAYDELRKLHKEAGNLASVGQLLNWDQETYMPHAAGTARADQQAIISTLVHERKTSKRVGELIAACENNGVMHSDESAAANIREMRRDYDLATKLPTELVAELTRTTSLAQEAWKEARAKNDFKAFAPWLEKVMDLTRQKGRCYGVPTGGELYDALLNEYEPEMRAAEIEKIFTPLRDKLSRLVAELTASKTKPDDKLLKFKASDDQQRQFVEVVLKAMGFDMTAGRLDTTTHPFCSGVAPGDTRLTFRYNNDSFLEPLYGVMHEAGHGIYEQGLPKSEHFGEPLGDAVSLGIHESQSRLWENMVGRSREFWQWALPHAKKAFAPMMDKVSLDEVYGAANIVQPSFIRVEADEATYNLHVMLRFGIERALINGSLKVADLPSVWNAEFKKLLGLDVTDDRRGCLQDVHWSFGLVGYFPTYTLGNLYGAQLWEKVNAEIPTLRQQMTRGEFGELKTWLNRKVHIHGRRYPAAELCKRVTGQTLTSDALLRHLEGKLRPLYGI